MRMILSTYPEHTDNEFIAEASARFTLEAEQAVNFAASWQIMAGMVLACDCNQADAAHKMAEI